jgi:hypothetical protein
MREKTHIRMGRNRRHRIVAMTTWDTSFESKRARRHSSCARAMTPHLRSAK